MLSSYISCLVGGGALVEFFQNKQRRLLLLLGLLALASGIVFMTLGARGNWDFVLPFRAPKLLGLVLVGTAIAVSTVLFQTVTQNRILTPSIMGFDALFVAIQSALVVFLGSARVSALDPQMRFALQALLMIGLATLLFRWLFADGRRSIHLLVLSGIVFGIFCRSLSNMLQRILDPNEFAVLQDLLFARFNVIEATLLPVAAVVIIIVSLVAWWRAPALDVLALGRETAISLGLDHQRFITFLLALIVVLVSVSTALVGPVLFFGLLVANLAYQLLGTAQHRYTLPAAALLAVICLVGGQIVLERLLGFDGALSIVIEFVGGIIFILLLLKDRRP